MFERMYSCRFPYEAITKELTDSSFNWVIIACTNVIRNGSRGRIAGYMRSLLRYREKISALGVAIGEA